jgi:hypothetical protein
LPASVASQSLKDPSSSAHFASLSRMHFSLFGVADDKGFQRIQPKVIHIGTTQYLACGLLDELSDPTSGSWRELESNPRRTPL